MGCSTSKLDSLPAVALCRDRCGFVEDALHHSYAFADAHVAYSRSLKTLGSTLHQFFDDRNVPDPPSSAAKPANSPPPPPLDRSPSIMTSDSHIQFDSDSEDEEDSNTDSESFIKNRHDYFDQQNLVSSPELFNSRSYRYNSYSTYNSQFGVGDWPQSKSPPPPPPPPSNSAWDFLNFFEPLEKCEPLYSPVRNTKQIKESEKKKKEKPEDVSITDKDSKAEAGPTPTPSREKRDDDVAKKKTAVVAEKEQRGSTEPESKGGQSGQRCVSEVIRQVQAEFERASESGLEVSKMFDAGRFRYLHKHSVSQGCQVSSKMLYHAVSPTSSKTVPYTKLGRHQGLDDDVAVVIDSRNLTATLKKLCMWEKKLYGEVKAEEKLRILYARKCRQIRSLGAKGGESLKVDSIRTMIRTLSTQIKIAIQVIDKMSISINKLRDEELWLQINELVHRLLEMWKDMLECHRCQSQTITEAKNFDAIIASDAKLDNTHLEVAIQLKFELQNWTLNFSNWIESQKSYIRALNAWLQRCLPSEPEETPDGVAPFSPSIAGAPPVFVIVYQWSQAMDRLSEKEVTEAIHGFFTSINQLLEQHNVELQQMVTNNKDLDRKVKILEKEEQKMQKVFHIHDKKMTLPTREGSGIGSLHSGLKQIFIAIERYATNFKQVYDELHIRIEEGKFSQMNPTCP
ncbi:hypothetical protein LWI28_025388 [Acer negundo]|uniref:Nitrate regulatory gene2 protein-like n=1 Tax=Acer negundo TaxID=4023 RepID=A0AAD5JJG2_ACENE|nr:hypothetical protein LWI28_025388 [Acer negundo]KAK4853313.1 hypothetical protein QYF36_007010 [Acer negundo]